MTKNSFLLCFALLFVALPSLGQDSVTYQNTLTPIKRPQPLLADFPNYVAPVLEQNHYQAPALVNDKGTSIDVRAWRFSYNARGIIEIPNKLSSSETAIVFVHPWGVDDGQGWVTPDPAGVAFGGTPLKNEGILRHSREVIAPFLEQLRPHVNTILYSLPGEPDPARAAAYRTTAKSPSADTRKLGRQRMIKTLRSFNYKAQPVPTSLELGRETPVVDYFRQFRGIDASPHYNGVDFWQLPIPVMNSIEVHDNDVVFFDNQGYAELRAFLKKHGIRHILLVGYATDMCVCDTTAGYKNLRQDFNVFLVGDATQATHPANKNAAHATNQAISYAALDLLITQVSWIKPPGKTKLK